MSDLRPFFVLDSHGGSTVRARSASDALRRVSVPLGFRDVRAVVDASIIARVPSPAAFTAFFGLPVHLEGQR